MTKARTLDTQEIVQKLKSDQAKELFEANGVLAAYLFGSVAEGRTHAHSDVDVAVVFLRSVPALRYGKGRLAIIAGLMSLLDLDEVDVVPLNKAPALLSFEVIRTGITLYAADEYETAEFEIQALGLYYDLARELDSYLAEMQTRIKERGLA